MQTQTPSQNQTPWWIEAMAEIEKLPELDAQGRAFLEFARMRLAAIDELLELGGPEPRDLRWVMENMASRQEAQDMAGDRGDCAHWVWTFELDQPERELLRSMKPEMAVASLVDFAGLSRSMLASSQAIGWRALEPCGASARRASRASGLALDILRAKRPAQAPFGARESEGWAKRSLDWFRGGLERAPLFARLKAAHPDFAAAGVFDDSEQAPARAQLGMQEQAMLLGKIMQKLAALVAPAPPEPSPAARDLSAALEFSTLIRPSSTPWPIERLRAWAQAKILDAATAPAPKRASARL